MFKPLEPAVQDFLVKTAVLPFMTGRMAQALTGRRDAAGILNELHQRLYFTERRLSSEAVCHYHPLLREYLLTKLHDRPRVKEL